MSLKYLSKLYYSQNFIIFKTSLYPHFIIVVLYYSLLFRKNYSKKAGVFRNIFRKIYLKIHKIYNNIFISLGKVGFFIYFYIHKLIKSFSEKRYTEALQRSSQCFIA